MPYISKRTRRHILWFVCAIFAAAASNVLFSTLIRLRHTASLLYCGILIAWILTVQKRVIRLRVRRFLVAAAGLCALLFILRVCRWDLFTWSPAIERYLWYAYYIPLCTAPLCVLCAAKCVGGRKEDEPLRRVRWLWGLCAVLILGFLTNDLHGAAFRITGYRDGEYVYTHGRLYALMAVWTAALLLWSFSALLRYSLIMGRGLWSLPVAWAALSTGLLGPFLVSGSSPQFLGVHLYNFQEVWTALIVGTLECFIQIGLIPSNNDYEEIFQKSHWDAVLASRGGDVVFRTADAFLPTPEQIVRAVREPVAVDAGHILYGQKVRGGIACHLVDRTGINETNRQIAEAVEYLEEENDLLAEEDRIRAAHTSYVTQNLIYDGVIPVVQPQLHEAERLLREDAADEGSYRRDILRAMVLCDYAKRRINLSLIARASSALSSGELALAIRETLEYLSVGGVETALDCSGKAPFPAEQIILAYDFFEAVLEAALPGLGALFAHVEADRTLRLRLVMETPAALPPKDRFARQMDRLGAVLSLRMEEDEGFVRLSFGKGDGKA